MPRPVRFPLLQFPISLLLGGLVWTGGFMPAAAQFGPVWEIGADDQTFAGSAEEWSVDDNFTVGEPVTGLERSLSRDDPFTQILFNLTPAQRGPSARLRIRVDLCAPGWMIPNGNWLGQGWHDVQISLNGVVVKSAKIAAEDSMLVVEMNAPALPLLPINNILRLHRTGGSDSTPAGAASWSWIGLDYLSLAVDETALTDPDGDGLPSWWEREWLRDPALAGALADPDRDGLTDLQEMGAGTNPDMADTDGDGLNDAGETLAAPYSNPLMADSDHDGLTDFAEKSRTPPTQPQQADSDSDGASDSWEKHMGTDPLSVISLPPVFSQAIGLDFVQRAHASAPGPSAVAGVVPQRFWNATQPAAPWSPTDGTMVQIAQPLPGILLNSAGLPTTVLAQWSSVQAGFNGSQGGANGLLLEGFLQASETTPATVTLTNIPYASYDVIAYVASRSNQYRGMAEIAGRPATRRYFLTDAPAPFQSWTEATTTQAELDAAVAGTTIPEEIQRRRQSACRSGNYVRFRGLTGATVTLEIRQDQYGAGLAAVQIVDTSADRDGDGMVNSYEFTHGFQVASNDAASDADGDGLTNFQEYSQGSHPRRNDTDDDGLADAIESLPNRLTPDSDSDGLSDAAETNALRPTNPNAADSDGDGLADAEELVANSDPLTPGGASRPVPVYSNPGAGGLPEWAWEVDLQLVINRGTAPLTEAGYGPRAVANIAVHNTSDPSGTSLLMELRSEAGKLTWLLHTSRTGSFSAAGAPGNSAWYADWSSPEDLTALLGFSGHGEADISDRLRFRLSAVRPGAGNSWNLTFQILNLDQNPGAQVVLNRTFLNTTASGSTHNGTATWTGSNDASGLPDQSSLYTLPGVTAWLGYPALESLPAFSSARDSDEDGMPDIWEETHAFNKNLAGDGPADADNDGLSNVRECLAGTQPRQSDSDSDGVGDGDEKLSGSDPLLATSRPAFFNTPPAAGEDLNGNQLPDAWEMWAGSFSLTAASDTDRDGFSNLVEARLGTNPQDPQSWLTLDWQSLTPTTAQVRWTHLPHKSHWLLSSPDQITWTPLAGVPGTSGEWKTYPVPQPDVNTQQRLFYRPEILDLDQDGDGLSDWSEQQLGTSVLSANSARAAALRDTDNNGLPDAFLAGDYAAFAERLGGQAAGNYAGLAPGLMSRPQASRLLHQATFGPTMADIDRLSAMGAGAWLTDQMALPPTRHSPYIQQIYRDFFGQQTDRSYNGSDQDSFLFGNNVSTPFFRAAVSAPDQLRQRIAFALSQILVASRRDAALENTPLGLTDFYDIFVRHAFGNYQDILLEVSLHPVMGRYLSHIGNQKANPALNQYPDENYAREVMQLFSIGLWELHPDGSRKLTPAGDPVPTYSNSQITEFARVFTGLWFGGQEWLEGGFNDANYAVPMDMFAEPHDFGVKTLLNGMVIPARAPTRENAMQDVRDAVKCLFQHSNTPVFISRQLIQFLVTSNPSPAYVSRIQGVFVNNGSGVRGDLAAVIRAILLDPEARDPRWSIADPDFGKLREPVIRTMHLARLGGLARLQAPVWWNWGDFYDAMKQEVLLSPSVFNFYRPDYQAPGLLSQRNLTGPVFQITDSYSAISVPNKLWEFLHQGMSPSYGTTYSLDFPEELPLAATPERLVDRMNLLLCAGRLSAVSRAVILNAVNDMPAAQTRARVHLAVYLCLTAPEGAIQR